MTWDMGIVLAILTIAIGLFVTEWLRVDIVALGVVVALMLPINLALEKVELVSAVAILALQQRPERGAGYYGVADKGRDSGEKPGDHPSQSRSHGCCLGARAVV